MDMEKDHRFLIKDSLGGNLRSVTLYPNDRDRYDIFLPAQRMEL